MAVSETIKPFVLSIILASLCVGCLGRLETSLEDPVDPKPTNNTPAPDDMKPVQDADMPPEDMSPKPSDMSDVTDTSDLSDASDSTQDADMPSEEDMPTQDMPPEEDMTDVPDMPDAEPDMVVTPPTGQSPGCAAPMPNTTSPDQRSHTFSADAGNERSYHIVLPTNYDHTKPHRVIVAYAGTNWSGSMIRPYFNLEDRQRKEIYVYPDLKFREFDGWGNLGGWLLGPYAAPADGMEDLEFTRELLTLLQAQYCIDPNKIFATGHSWGGDMAAVVACFLGDIFRATAPAAANRPYWFERRRIPLAHCTGKTHVWTFFGQNETHFTWQSRPGEFGEQQVAFWSTKNGCSQNSNPIAGGGPVTNECIEYQGCSHQNRYCYYDPSAGHQIPSYFTSTVMAWFRSFQ